MVAKRNAVATRARILAVATRTFAETGFVGTSLRALADGANVSLRMIYHYFDSKEGLYREVFVDLWSRFGGFLDARLAERQQAGDAQPAELLREGVLALFDFVARHPEFCRLLMWEGLEGGAISRSLWDARLGPMLARMGGLIDELRASGDVPSELAPQQILIDLIGAVLHYFAYASSLGGLIGADPMSPESLDARRRHLSRQAMRAFGVVESD